MKTYRGVGLGSGFVRGRIEVARGKQGSEEYGEATIVMFRTVPSVRELLETVRTGRVKGVILPQCSPYSHLGWAISYSGVPAIAMNYLGNKHKHKTAYLDAKSGAVLYPESREEAQFLKEEYTRQKAETERIATRAHLPALSRGGVAIRILAQIQSVEDVLVALESGAEGVGEIKSELLGDEEGGRGAAASIVNAIKKETPWKEIPIRFFDLDKEKLGGSCKRQNCAGPLGARGIRLLESNDDLMVQFLKMLEGTDLEGIIVVLPMVTLPVEVQRFRERLMGCPLRIGVLVETPAAAISIEKFLDLCDYFEIGVNDLTQYTMAWNRIVPHKELLPAASLTQPVERLISTVAEAVREKQGFASLAVDLPPSTQLVRQILNARLEAITVPPRLIPAWKETIRLAQ